MASAGRGPNRKATETNPNDHVLSIAIFIRAGLFFLQMRKIPLQTRRPGTKYNMDAEDLCLGAHDLGKCFAERNLSLRAHDFDIAIR